MLQIRFFQWFLCARNATGGEALNYRRKAVGGADTGVNKIGAICSPRLCLPHLWRLVGCHETGGRIAASSCSGYGLIIFALRISCDLHSPRKKHKSGAGHGPRHLTGSHSFGRCPSYKRLKHRASRSFGWGIPTRIRATREILRQIPGIVRPK